jgi:hypothetical protein
VTWLSVQQGQQQQLQIVRAELAAARETIAVAAAEAARATKAATTVTAALAATMMMTDGVPQGMKLKAVGIGKTAAGSGEVFEAALATVLGAVI